MAALSASLRNLRQRRVEPLGGDAEPREALGTELLGLVGQLVESAAREARRRRALASPSRSWR